MGLTYPDHLLSLAEWDALPRDANYRLELVEGVLLVVPRALALHQRAMVRLTTLLDDRLPPHLCALADCEVVVFGAEHGGEPVTVRAPDVIVVRSDLAATNPARFDASDVLIAVEVQSPGTVRTDRVTKMAEYADAGIAGYWLVDVEPPLLLTAFGLVDGRYELMAETDSHLDVLTPLSLSLDISGIVRR